MAAYGIQQKQPMVCVRHDWVGKWHSWLLLVPAYRGLPPWVRGRQFLQENRPVEEFDLSPVIFP